VLDVNRVVAVGDQIRLPGLKLILLLLILLLLLLTVLSSNRVIAFYSLTLFFLQ